MDKVEIVRTSGNDVVTLTAEYIAYEQLYGVVVRLNGEMVRCTCVDRCDLFGRAEELIQSALSEQREWYKQQKPRLAVVQ